MHTLRILLALTSLASTHLTLAQQGEQPASPIVQPAADEPENPSNEFNTGGFGAFDSGTGMGGPGGFGGAAMGLPASAIPGKKWVASSKVIVAVSDDGGQVFAYSEQHPRWVAQELEPLPPEFAVIPTVGDVAAVRHGNHCYAFSPTLGRWDHLKLPAGEVAIPMIGTDSVSVHSGSQGDYVFKDSWGKWFSADEIKAGKVAEFLQMRQETAFLQMRQETAPQIQSSRIAEGTIRIFHLQYIKASDAVRLLREFYGDTINPIADDRTNSLLLGDVIEPVFEQIQAILEQLDSPTPKRVIDPFPPSQSVDELRKLSDRLEQFTLELAAAARDAGENSLTAKTLGKELRDTVRKAFEARQRLQRAELAEFTKRLQATQRLIESRELIAEKIIDRRVQELLDPSLKWDDGAAADDRGVVEPNSPITLSLDRSSANDPKISTPEATLYQIWECGERKDYAAFMRLLTDREAERMAGMLL